jgi:5-methyltetrahydrofolate--homocysteine methyltransferase
MGATLEQYDLSLEDDYKLPGRCHEALVLNRPTSSSSCTPR